MILVEWLLVLSCLTFFFQYVFYLNELYIDMCIATTIVQWKYENCMLENNDLICYVNAYVFYPVYLRVYRLKL